MSLLQTGIAKSGAADAYEIENSLRGTFDGDYLSRLVAATGNRKTWTWSGWVKRGSLDDPSYCMGVKYSEDTSNHMGWGFRKTHATAYKDFTFLVEWNIAGGGTQGLHSNAKYRDPAAWYHVVVALDTTQSTVIERLRVYINGEEITSWGEDDRSNITQDVEMSMNLVSRTQEVGTIGNSGSDGVNGYLAEVYLIDGTALEPDSFGELSSTTNQWIPLDSDTVKDAVTFGTNGFYQKYGSTELADSFTDSANYHSTYTITRNGSPVTKTGEKKFGTASCLLANTGGTTDQWLKTTSSTDWNFYGDVTVECWVKFITGAAYQGIIASKVDGYDGWSLRTDISGSDKIASFNFYNDSASATFACLGTSDIGDGDWHHVAGVRNGTTVRIFVDGTQENSLTYSGTIHGASSGGYGLQVGMDYLDATGSGPIHAYVDEVRISKGMARYTADFSVATSAFTADAYTSLLLHMDGSDDGTTFTDSSWVGTGGAGRNGITANGDVTNTRAVRKIGDSSIKFDGTGDYLSIPCSSMGLTGDFTMECWFNTASAASDNGILSNRYNDSGTNGNFSIRINDGGNNNDISYRSYNGTVAEGGYVISSAAAWSDNTWTHVAVVRSGSGTGNVKLYIDGTLAGTSAGESSSTILGNSGNFWVGGQDNANYLNGYIDEVRVSDSARYTSSFTPSTTAFTADANTLLLIHSDWTGGLGADSSGNYNTFTPTNLVATDQMIDTPTNNFATFNALSYGDNGGNFELREGNLQAYMTSGVGKTHSTFSLFDDGCYWEMMVGDTGGGYGIALLKNANLTTSSQLGADSYSEIAYRPSTGNLDIDGSTDATYATASAGDILNFAFKSGRLYVGKSNTWFNSGAPASGTGYVNGSAVTGDWCAACSLGANSPNYGSINFGADSSFAGKTTAQGNQDDNEKGDFYYTPPTDYLALCTDNLSDPEIALPGENFNSLKFVGTGSAQAITGVGFTPDWVWLKNRDTAGTYHILSDTVRGANKQLYSNATDAEASGTTQLTAFGSDGFSVGTASDSNQSTKNIISWNWKAGGAPTADNSAGAGATPTAGSVKIDGANLGSALAGTIAATRLSANTTSGMSIVEYVGNQTSGDTVAHGLSVAPEMIIIKSMDDVDQWSVYSKPVGNTKALYLNLTNAAATATGFWNDTTPSSTIFTLGNETQLNKSGSDYIAYCFNSIEGYSKVGSYTGNGVVDGPFMYTGFKPAFVMLKNIETATNWPILDNKRSPYNLAHNYVFADNTNAEESGVDAEDFLSNGWKIRTDSTEWNQSGKTYIYIAFAESPFKYSNAR